MRAATNERARSLTQRKILDVLRALPQHAPPALARSTWASISPQPDPASNLIWSKFLDMGVELQLSAEYDEPQPAP